MQANKYDGSQLTLLCGPVSRFSWFSCWRVFKTVATMDIKLLVVIAFEAILGYERTNVPGQEAAELFEDIKAEMDEQSKDSVS